MDDEFGEDGGGFGPGNQFAEAEEDVWLRGEFVLPAPVDDTGEGAEGEGGEVRAVLGFGGVNGVEAGGPNRGRTCPCFSGGTASGHEQSSIP